MSKVKPYKFNEIFQIGTQIATLNLVPGYKSANEYLVQIDNQEYRIWDPWTSKPCAAFLKGLKNFPLEKGNKVLYLGIASGKTASFFSDIIGKNGIIYGIDIAERVLRDLISVAEKRGNIIPILGDGRKPEEYANQILEKVDIVYEDVASDDQIQILIRNCEKFLKPNGWAMIAIKSQSIDVTKPPQQVYKESLKILKERFEIIEKVELDPYEKAHLFVILKMK